MKGSCLSYLLVPVAYCLLFFLMVKDLGGAVQIRLKIWRPKSNPSVGFDRELRCRSKNWRVMNEYYVLSHVAAELCRDDLTEAAQKVPLFDQRSSECQITGSNDGGL
ncbi:MAG: hypothetical protein DWH78_11115 [Planctomycetota bacterium]|nr:MAG: hypothetical protein DWH78_11115 [Planctomycetota bacterium]